MTFPEPRYFLTGDDGSSHSRPLSLRRAVVEPRMGPRSTLLKGRVPTTVTYTFRFLWPPLVDVTKGIGSAEVRWQLEGFPVPYRG